MPRGKSVTKLLLDSSEAALFAGIEIHNKPNIKYRYPTAVILIINAWELMLKAYVYRYIEKKKIYEKNDGTHTISFTRALNLVKEDIIRKNSKDIFISWSCNLEKLNDYRCSNVHFYETKLDPIIFMLLSKAVLNYDSFVKRYFARDITKSDNLIILPIGFKLPFDPVEYLTQKRSDTHNSFVNGILNTIRELDSKGIQDNIVIGFGLYTTSIKKVDNADLIAAVDQYNGQITLSREYRLTNDPKAPALRVEPNLPPLTYNDLRVRIKEIRPDIKFNKVFNSVMKEIKCDNTLCKANYLNPNDKSSTNKIFYYEFAIKKVIELYDIKTRD